MVRSPLPSRPSSCWEGRVSSRVYPSPLPQRSRPPTKGRRLAARTQLGRLSVSDHQGWQRRAALLYQRRGLQQQAPRHAQVLRRIADQLGTGRMLSGAARCPAPFSPTPLASELQHPCYLHMQSTVALANHRRAASIVCGSFPKLPAISAQAASNASPIAFKASGPNAAPSMSCRAFTIFATLT